MCYDHDECPDDMPCVLGYCGEKQYFEAIGDIQCENDEVCKVSNKQEYIVFKKMEILQDLLLGEQCCYDVSDPSSGIIGRKCCDHSDGVIAPNPEISIENIKKVGYVAVRSGGS